MIPENIGETMKVNVTVTRHYSKQSIDIGADITIQSCTGSELAKVYDDLYSAVMQQHRLLIENITARASLPDAQPITDRSPSAELGTDKIIDVEYINVEFKSNKAYYKVKGGQFEKWGVRLWLDADVIGRVDNLIDFKRMDGGDNVPAVNLRAVIEMDGEKPKRVRRLYAADQDSVF